MTECRRAVFNSLHELLLLYCQQQSLLIITVVTTFNVITINVLFVRDVSLLILTL